MIFISYEKGFVAVAQQVAFLLFEGDETVKGGLK
jgi:hypothetical protein